jgi:predicted Zn-dependent protease
VLAELPAGARHASAPSRDLTRTRLDIALPLAQFDISRARATGDLRFLGYGEAILLPWLSRPPLSPAVLVLHATILQSRHQFDAALKELDQALKLRPDDPQAWLTRATVLRVVGRYPEALESCGHLAAAADPAILTLCTQSVQSLTGHLQDAYATVAALPQQSMPPEARAWRYSELGEMAERLGNDAAAEHWLREGLQVAPDDFYLRGACADLLLRQQRAMETLELLRGYEAMEPMLLRITIAHMQLHDGDSARSQVLLQNAFELEQQRGDAVHRREQARFFLDVDRQPGAALAAAQQNWRVQREPDDLLILLRAARAADQPQQAAPALEFLQQHRLEDARALIADRSPP